MSPDRSNGLCLNANRTESGYPLYDSLQLLRHTVPARCQRSQWGGFSFAFAPFVLCQIKTIWFELGERISGIQVGTDLHAQVTLASVAGWVGFEATGFRHGKQTKRAAVAKRVKYRRGFG